MAAIGKLRLLVSRKTTGDRSVAAPVIVAADDDDLPMPSDIKTVFLGGLFLLGVLAACYVAADIVLPVVLALVLKLVLQPAMRALERVHLPNGVSAFLIILMLFGTLAGLGAALSGPAASWAQKLPSGISQIAGTVDLSKPAVSGS